MNVCEMKFSAKIVSLMDDMTSFFKIELLVKSVVAAILVAALVAGFAYIALG